MEFPLLRSPREWACALFVATVLFFTGIPLFYRPSFEIIYDASSFDGGCFKSQCSRHFTVQVGNTGWENQSEVTVELHEAFLEYLQIPPKAYTFGKVPRPLKVESDGTTTRWKLGHIEAGKRVDIHFSLFAPSGVELPQWSDLLLAVRPSQGASHAGAPEWTTFSRFILFFVR